MLAISIISFFIAFYHSCLHIFIQKNKFNTDTIVSFYLSHAFIVRDLIQIRAGLAVSISLYSIIKFKGNKSIITGVLFASLIHSGALIIALCYPFFKKIHNIKNDVVFIFSVNYFFLFEWA